MKAQQRSLATMTLDTVLADQMLRETDVTHVLLVSLNFQDVKVNLGFKLVFLQLNDTLVTIYCFLYEYSLFSKVLIISIFIACLCDEEGSNGKGCGESNGKCECKDNVVGDKCTQCTDGTYMFPECEGIKSRPFFKDLSNAFKN